MFIDMNEKKYFWDWSKWVSHHPIIAEINTADSIQNWKQLVGRKVAYYEDANYARPTNSKQKCMIRTNGCLFIFHTFIVEGA